MRAAFLAIPREALCREDPPDVEIRGGDCDSFVSRGFRVRGETIFDKRVAVPGSLGALAHEWAHLIACDIGHGKDSWSRKCGDPIDRQPRETQAAPTGEMRTR